MKYIPDKVFYCINKRTGWAIVTSRRDTIYTGNSIVRETENKPIRNIKVACADTGVKGATFGVEIKIGNDYCKSAIPDEELLDLIQQGALKKGGTITAPMVWVGSGKFPKLTRVGSETYKSYISKTVEREAKPIRKENLKVGGVYKTIGGTVGIYLGQVNTIRFTIPYASGMIKDKQVRGATLWLESSSNQRQRGTFKYLLEKLTYVRVSTGRGTGVDLTHEQQFCKLCIKATHSYKIDCDRSVTVPSNIVEQLRDKCMQHLISLPWETNKSRWLSSYEIPTLLVTYAELVTMVRYNSEPTMAPWLERIIEVRGFVLINRIPLSELPIYLTHENQEVRKTAAQRVKVLGKTVEELLKTKRRQ